MNNAPIDRMKERVQPWRLGVWAFIALCFATAVAASLFSPMSWREYARYVTSTLGWELATALLTAGVAVVMALFVARLRHSSGIVAVSMFSSVVLHMLLVSIFGLVTLNHATVISGNEKKREIAFGLPSLSESLAGQELRAMFKETALSDERRFAEERKSRIDLLDAKSARIQPELKQNDLSVMAAEKMRIEKSFASKPKQAVKDTLAAIPDITPDVAQPDLGRLKPMKHNNNVASKVRPVTRDLKVEPDKEARLDLPVDPASAAREARIEDGRRDLQREKIEVADRRLSGQNIQEVLRATAIGDKPDRLDMKAVNEPVSGAGAKPETRQQPQRAFDVSHQAGTESATPAPKRLVREVADARPASGAGSLADSYSVRAERQPVVEDAVIRGARNGVDSLVQPVRVRDTMVSAGAGGSTVKSGERTLNARSSLRSDRASRSVAGAEIAAVVPRAHIDLGTGQGTPGPSFAVGSGVTDIARAERPGVREDLSAETSRGIAGRPVMAVGGTAALAKRWNQEPDGSATAGRSHERPVGIASSRAETGLASAADRPAVSSSSPAAVDLSRHGLYAAGTAVREAQDDISVARPQKGAPGSYQELAGSGGGTGLTSERRSMVKIGTAVSPVAGGAYAVSEASGSAGGSSRGGGADGRQFSSARRQTGLIVVETAQAQRPAFGEALASGSGVEPGGGGDTQPVGSGAELRTAKPVLKTEQVGSGAGIDRADLLNTRIIPGAAHAVQGPGGMSESGAGGTVGSRQPAGATEIRVGKAAGSPGEFSGSERGLVRVSAGTSGRYVEYADSLVGSSEAPASRLSAGGSAAVISSGVSLSKAPSVLVAGSEHVSIGLAAIEATDVRPAGRQGGGRETGQAGTSKTLTGRSEVLVSKAGGQLVSDAGSGPAGGGAGSVGLDSIGSSASLSRGPSRLVNEVTGKDGGTSGHGIAAGIPGGGPGSEAMRTVISSELSQVPASVTEKAIYKLRDPGKRKEFIAELGGSEKTEQGVEHALAWLGGTQSDDGRWDIDGFKTLSTCGGPGDQVNEDVALTGLCLLSYLGAGYTHVKGDHKETVRKAVNWLVVGQKEDGNLQRSGQMYGQAIATAALCECYSMTGDKRLIEPVQKAVDFILKSQNPGAGWRYQPRTDNDTSVTGWQVLALKSAMIAGIKFPPEHFEWVEKWLDCVRRGEGGGLYTYMPGHGATPTMTAEGWFCQLLMKEQTRTRGQAETIPYLMERLPAWTPKDGGINIYFWYYATLALHMSGAQEFQKWNQALTKALLAGQVKKGAGAGSWDPVDVLGERGGRIYSTATAALCLEVYYRYLPFYKQR